MAVNMSIGLILKHQKHERYFELMSEYALTYLPEDESFLSNDNHPFPKSFFARVTSSGVKFSTYFFYRKCPNISVKNIWHTSKRITEIIYPGHVY